MRFDMSTYGITLLGLLCGLLAFNLWLQEDAIVQVGAAGLLLMRILLLLALLRGASQRAANLRVLGRSATNEELYVLTGRVGWSLLQDLIRFVLRTYGLPFLLLMLATFLLVAGASAPTYPFTPDQIGLLDYPGNFTATSPSALLLAASMIVLFTLA